MKRRLSHVVGFDDGPFARSHRGDVMVIGAVFSGLRLEGVLRTEVRRDGANATAKLIASVSGSRFGDHLQLVLLQGIALAGFNVIDIEALHDALGMPVLVVARRQPNLDAVERALLSRVAGGRRKWRLIERLGPMQPAAGVFVQRAGIELREATALIERLAVHGRMPEPLRVAHMIAGGVTSGESRRRV